MEARRLEADAISYNAAVSTCERGHEWQNAYECLTRLEAMQARNVEADVVSYNAAISACEKGRPWEKALQLLEAIQARNVEADVICDSAAISACSKGNSGITLFAAAEGDAGAQSGGQLDQLQCRHQYLREKVVSDRRPGSFWRRCRRTEWRPT